MPTAADLLEFEDSWRRRHSGVKEEAIRARFGIPPARFYQLLHRVLDGHDALESHPMVVLRLRRLREQRHADRESGLRAS